MKKILLIAFIITLVFLVIIAVVSLFYLGPIVKIGVEQFAPQITKVSVNIDRADVSLLGSAAIKGLELGNPQGYVNPQAIKVGTISISLDPLSVTTSKILIHSVHVESPLISFELGLGGNNLSKILNNVNAYSKNPQPAPKIEIDDFLITNAKIDVVIGGVINKTLPLPDIHLTNLGKGSDGLTPVELIRKILSAILTGTLKTVAGTAGSITQTLGSLTSSIGSLFGK